MTLAIRHSASDLTGIRPDIVVTVILVAPVLSKCHFRAQSKSAAQKSDEVDELHLPERRDDFDRVVPLSNANVQACSYTLSPSRSPMMRS